MSGVLVVSAADLTPELGRTILWRSSMRKAFASDVATAFDAAQAFRPSLVLIDAERPDSACEFARRLRRDPATRSTAIVVLSHSVTLADQELLHQAGANVVLGAPVDPALWDTRLEELLNVPRRRAARLWVRLAAWSRPRPGAEIMEGYSLNISLHGLLLEVPRRIAVGTKLDIALRLPGEETDVEAVGQVVREELNGDGPRSGVKFLVLRGDARERIRAFVEAGLRSDDAATVPTTGPAAESREWEAEARGNQALLTAMFEASLDAIVLMDQEGRIVEFNRAAEQMFGYERAKVLGRPVADTLVPPALRGAHFQGYTRRLTAAEEDPGRRFETVALRADGTELPVEAAVALVHAGPRRLFSAHIRDLTERQRAERLESQLRQSQKIEAVGRLAGGVAHDFNNLLNVIIGCGELVMRGLPEAHASRRHAREVLKAADRAAGLTRQLLAFSRKQVLQPRVLDLNAVVADMEPMLRRLIGEHIELRVERHPGRVTVNADPSQIEQVLLNLAVNARDAMPRGGTLRVETGPVELDAGYVKAHVGARSGPYALLKVSDTGSGMDAETRSHVFEPFFTTKAPGLGTGLGLATVYGIVKQSGGYIWLESEPGAGAVFEVYLPRAAGDADALPQRASSEPAGGHEVVMVVEDEEAVRGMACEVLEQAGYQVLDAGHGAAALEIASRHVGAIHLLVTDVVMPGMSGLDLAERLRQLRPNVKVLYVSGHSDDALGPHGVLGPTIAFLQKPFKIEAFQRKVREVLDAG